METKFVVKLLTYTYGIEFEWVQLQTEKDGKKKYQYHLNTKKRIQSDFHSWHKLRSHIYLLNERKNHKPCSDEVSDDYIYQLKKDQPISPKVVPQIAPWSKETFPKKDDVFDVSLAPYRRNVIMVGYTENKQPFGFVVGNANTASTYIDVICGSPGQILLNSFIDWSGKRRVRLSSLLRVISYYPKFGFEFGKCGQYPELTEKVQSFAPNVFSDSSKIPKDAQKVIEEMRDKHLINDASHSKICKKLKTDSFLHRNCFENGVQMERCQPKKFVLKRRTRHDLGLRSNGAVALRTRSHHKH